MAGPHTVIPYGKTLKFRGVATTLSTRIKSPAVGDVSMDTTSGLQECISAGTWRQVGTGATSGATLDTAYDATQVMSETLNLALGVGNDQFEDVKDLTAAFNRLSGILDRFRDRARS